MKKALANHEIVTLAVYLLGGDAGRVDTEDVAVRANAIAPGRFTWAKYPDQINIGNVRWALWDAKKPENGRYVLGSEKKGWMVTEAGLKFAKDRAKGFRGRDLARQPVSPRDRNRLQRERTRLLATEAFMKFQHGGADAVTPQEAEGFFRIDDYVRGDAREQKITRITNMFGDDPQLGPAIQALRKKIRVG